MISSRVFLERVHVLCLFASSGIYFVGTARLNMFLDINLIDFFESLIETYAELIATVRMNKIDFLNEGNCGYVKHDTIQNHTWYFKGCAFYILLKLF